MSQPPNRRIVPGVKDSSGAYVAPKAPEVEVTPNPPTSGVSLDDLLNKQLLVLFRQTARFVKISATDLLSKDQEMAFDRCVRLTRELKKDERVLFENLSDEELEKIANDGND